jgi:hypothetical protein
MQKRPVPSDDGTTYCLRHPNVESNLRCGRCDDLICPRCMVTSPVGARCPDCARIGRPAILDTSSSELTRAVLSGFIAAFGGAIALSIVIRILFEMPFVIGIVDWIVAAGGMALIGYAIGEAIRYGSGKKIDQRLKYVAAVCVFASWVAVMAILPLIGIQAAFIAAFPGIVGMIIAFYIASSRVRP